MHYEGIEVNYFDSYIKQVIVEMTNGGVDRSVECTGSIQAMISAFECVHDVIKFPTIDPSIHFSISFPYLYIVHICV